jgi:D-tyrosyl-tRNA(Tyr) deacylase
MKEIIRAENAGFCFGVRQAIEKAERAAENTEGKIYSMGSLIHNERVTGDLEKKGIKMKLVIQRVSNGEVSIAREVVGKIGKGLVVLVGIAPEDTEKTARVLADKLCAMRSFEDEEGKMNRSVLDEGGSILLISQFTLFADCRRGNRPGFSGAARPEHASPLFDRFCEMVAEKVPVERGRFGADMKVSLTNDGPVTIVIECIGEKVC